MCKCLCFWKRINEIWTAHQQYRNGVIYWVKGSVHVLFWKFHYRGEGERKGRECKFPNKAHEPLTQEITTLLSISWAKIKLYRFLPHKQNTDLKRLNPLHISACKYLFWFVGKWRENVTTCELNLPQKLEVGWWHVSNKAKCALEQLRRACFGWDE